MSRLFNTKPLQSITAEDVDKIFLHMTYGGLRRATSVKPTEMVAASDSMPALYYTEERNPETGEIKYSIHAITSDVLRYLWKQSIGSSSEETPSEDTENTETEETQE